MFYLKDKREARLFKITGIEGTEVEEALKVILKEYDNIVSRKVHDIGNCQTIEYIIRLLDEISVMKK